MKQTVKAEQPDDAWSAPALFAKAERQMQRAQLLDKNLFEFEFACTLALELLARAALANIHPALLAEQDKAGYQLMRSLGFEPIERSQGGGAPAQRRPSTAREINPDSHCKVQTPISRARSISSSDVIQRLVALMPSFSEEHRRTCEWHFARRNAELHSGENVTPEKDSAWLPRFYRAVQVILASMGKHLTDLIGAREAEVATHIMADGAAEDEKELRRILACHLETWNGFDEDEQAGKRLLAEQWAKLFGDRDTICPACKSCGCVYGQPSAPGRVEIESGALVIRQEYLPSNFSCTACGLQVYGYTRLATLGLADRYIEARPAPEPTSGDAVIPPDAYSE